MRIALNLALAAALAVVPLAMPDRSEAQAPGGFVSHRNVQYATVDGVPLRLDLYLPAQGEGPFPVLVWIHGGGWRGGTKDLAPGGTMVRQTARGYAVASIEYRLSRQALFPAQIYDCKGAIRWLRANAAEYALDPDRIGVWGSSAGGHLASMLGVTGDESVLEGDTGGNLQYSSRVRAVIDLYGPANLLTMNAQSLPCSTIDHDAPESPESLLLGCPVQSCADRARLASPVSYVSADDPPFLLIHGTNDCSVPPGQSQELHGDLVDAGVDATLRLLEGAGHGGPQFFAVETVAEMEAFFDENLAAVPADGEPPVVGSVNVRDGARKVRRGTTVDVTWTASDGVAVVSQTIELSLDEGATYQPIASNLPGDALSLAWTVSPDLPKAKRALVRVRARDAAGNEGSATSQVFKLK